MNEQMKFGMQQVLLNMEDNRSVFERVAATEAEGDGINRIKGKVGLGKEKHFFA